MPVTIDRRSTDHAVTVVVTRVVRPGCEAEFAAWADEVDTAVAECPGHLATIRLHDDEGVNHLVHQFDSRANLERWERSERRRELLRRGAELSEERRTAAGGRDAWFSVPGHDAPAGWKMFALSWSAVYPTLLVIAGAMALLPVKLPYLAELAVSSAVLTALLTWFILPRLERRAKPWLLRGEEPEPVERPG